MGTFKAVGYPEDVGRFYRLEEYEAYCWTAHGRYPTNTPGWWGGAHPFALLNYSIVHNGEISSYDTNRRFMEMFGYKCTLQTDTEVITYIADYLLRKQKLTLEELASVIAAPFWSTIDRKPPQEQEKLRYLRKVFSSLLITGPFSIVLGFEGGLMALNDRLKLRSMVVGERMTRCSSPARRQPCELWSPMWKHLCACRRRTRNRPRKGGEILMGIDYIYPPFEVVRDPARCISCRLCENSAPTGYIASTRKRNVCLLTRAAVWIVSAVFAFAPPMH